MRRPAGAGAARNLERWVCCAWWARCVSSACHVANALQVRGQLPAGSERAGLGVSWGRGQQNKKQAGANEHPPTHCSIRHGSQSVPQSNSPARGAEGGVLHPARLHERAPVRLAPLGDGQPQLAQAQGCTAMVRGGGRGGVHESVTAIFWRAVSGQQQVGLCSSIQSSCTTPASAALNSSQHQGQIVRSPPMSCAGGMSAKGTSSVSISQNTTPRLHTSAFSAGWEGEGRQGGGGSGEQKAGRRGREW